MTSRVVGTLLLSVGLGLALYGIAFAGDFVTETTTTSSPNPSAYGQTVTLTATVTSGAGTPAGTVTFRDGSTGLGTGALSAGGVATYTTTGLALGSHTLWADYGGSGSYATSSGSTSQTVDEIPTPMGLTAVPKPSIYGQKVGCLFAAHTAALGTKNGHKVRVRSRRFAATMATGTRETWPA